MRTITLLLLLFGFLIPAHSSAQQHQAEHAPDLLKRYPALAKAIADHPEALKTRANKSRPDSPGDEQNFWVYNFKSQSYEEKKFRLVRKEQMAQIWFQISEIDNNHLDDDVADSIIRSLEEASNNDSFDPSKGIVELSNEVFGEAPDKDGDDLVDFLITDIQDSWEDGCSCGYTAGFFNPADQLNAFIANQSGQRSNERDILYIDSYPGIYFNGNASPDKPLGTLAHEYQHLIHFNYNSGVNSEYTFINEAQSNFASLLNGYYPHPSFSDYLENTNVPVFRWDRDGDVLKDYGRAAAFSSYMWSLLGFEKAGTLTRTMENGEDAVERALRESGSGLSFGELLVNWSISSLVNGRGLNTDGTYSYNHPLISNLNAGNIPETEPGFSDRTVSVSEGGYTYLKLGSASNLSIRVSSGSPAAEARLLTVQNNRLSVTELPDDEEYRTAAGESFEQAWIVYVNTNPSPNGDSEADRISFSTTVQEYTSTATEGDAGMPGSVTLSQNYPNPFNPQTQIEFSLPESRNVNLSVYTRSGRRVVTLVSGRLAQGNYRYTWDAGNAASGVYLYKLEAGPFSSIRKMVLMK